MSERKRTWLITGVSSGLGRALAEAALGRGEVVIGTLRKREQTAEFEALAPGRAHLDVARCHRQEPSPRCRHAGHTSRPAASMWW